MVSKKKKAVETDGPSYNLEPPDSGKGVDAKELDVEKTPGGLDLSCWSEFRAVFCRGNRLPAIQA